MRGKKGGEMLSEGLAPWSRGACHVCVCFLIGLCSGAISGRSVWQGNLVLLCFDVVV